MISYKTTWSCAIMHSVGKREPFRKGVRFCICHVFAWLLSARHGDKNMVGRAGAQSPIMAQQGNNVPPPFRKLLFLETWSQEMGRNRGVPQGGTFLVLLRSLLLWMAHVLVARTGLAVSALTHSQ